MRLNKITDRRGLPIYTPNQVDITEGGGAASFSLSSQLYF